MLGAEVELQQVDSSVFALENVLKSWLHEQGGDREHLHLLLPSMGDTPVCIKCDIQERLISPALIPLSPNLGAKTESPRDFLLSKNSATQSPLPQRLKAIKVLCADGVCESLMYGLPLLLRPSCCWSLDWDDMESNHKIFHGLCHILRVRFTVIREPVSAEMVDLTEALVDMVIEDSQPFSIVEGTGFRKLVKALAPSCVLPTRQTLKAMVEKRYREAKDKAKVSRSLFLLLQSEPTHKTASRAAGVFSHYMLQASPSLSLLLKPVVSRELLLPCSVPPCTQEPCPEATSTVQASLQQLDEESVFNPLLLNSNLYVQLRSHGLLFHGRYTYKY
uniref:Hermes trasposase DNA-binding domain-containing protein n=1 Tax=Knipowitschia caucasica TaxID=637954 RepID=A0AAV2KM39_KNICA